MAGQEFEGNCVFLQRQKPSWGRGYRGVACAPKGEAFSSIIRTEQLLRLMRRQRKSRWSTRTSFLEASSDHGCRPCPRRTPRAPTQSHMGLTPALCEGSFDTRPLPATAGCKSVMGGLSLLHSLCPNGEPTLPGEQMSQG